jgi:integrase/recombinase XerD
MDWKSATKGFGSFLTLERSLSLHTREAYVHDIEKLQSFLKMRDLDIGPEKVELAHLSEFLQWLNELGYSKRSQARLISGVKAFYRYLLVEDLVRDNPTELLEGPRLDRDIPEVLSFEEIQAMIETIDLSKPQGHRNRAILETLYACGLRVSELAGLLLSNLYLDIGFIKVSGKGNKERLVPIGDEAVKHIEIYLRHTRNAQKPVAGHQDFLFLNRRGKRMSRVMIFLIVKEAAAAAEIGKTVSPHTFRHSFATHLIEGGADLRAVQDMLGHESILTTEIYTHLNTDFLRETLLTYHPRGKWRVESLE